MGLSTALLVCTAPLSAAAANGLDRPALEAPPPRPPLEYVDADHTRPTSDSLQLAVRWELHHGRLAEDYRRNRRMWVGGIATAGIGGAFVILGPTLAAVSQLDAFGAGSESMAAERTLGVGVVMAGTGVVMVLAGAVVSGVAGHRKSELQKRARHEVLGRAVAFEPRSMTLRF